VGTNPYENLSQALTPRKLKDLFKWCEFLFYKSPHIYAALRKFGEYPITDVTYDTTNDSLKTRHKFLLEKVLHAREMLINATLDKYVYGNAFISMYQPFIRYLKCPKCEAQANIEYINYKFNVRKLTFSYKCDACNSAVTATEKNVIDKKVMFGRKVNFIRWDPKLMDIEHNEITNTSIYYYTIPQTVIYRVNAGQKSLIDTLPLGFLRAVKSNKKFKFAPGAIYHLKIGGPAGLSPQWGLPPLLSVMDMFHYTAILRKANEAIAADHLVPFRVIHPAAASGNADPTISMSLSKWQDSLQYHMKQWRMDNLHIMYSPVPMGMTQVGGQGRALLTLGEVQEAEKNIVAALGIPLEFLYGGLTGSGMEATLRLIENQLESHINDLLGLLQWIDDKCADFLGWDKINVGMVKFRMVDDANAKQVVFQLWMQGQQGGQQVISDRTIADMYDIDLATEERNIRQETLDRIRMEQEMRHQVEALQNSMAEQARAEAQSGGPGPQGYNQQQVIAQADQTVQQLMQVDEGTRKSMLHQLQTEDMVMYSVVIQRLEQQQTSAKQQATAGM
jgi:transposase-like protein